VFDSAQWRWLVVEVGFVADMFYYKRRCEQQKRDADTSL
jgi:hypothetical protein